MSRRFKEIFKSQEDPTIYPTFDEMELDDGVLRGVFAYGFERPSDIQSKTIVPMCSGRDVIAQAQSGTGKTGTFSISTLQIIDPKVKAAQAIILSHTHELAEQIHTVFSELGRHRKLSGVVLAIGGTDVQENRKQLQNGAQVVIGTPGRVRDLINRRYLRLDQLRVLALDEADELLSRKFQDQVKEIIQRVPKTSQICIFSATLPPQVLELTELFMNDPFVILVEPEQLTLEGIRQFYVYAESDTAKLDLLLKLYQKLTISQSMIYCNTKEKAEVLYNEMTRLSYPVSVVHGDMPKDDRNRLMREFRTGKARMLISTDLLCRGIDIQQVSIVINFDLPRNRESYLHRIGRSGRFGRKGVAINFVTDDDYSQLDYLIRYFSTRIDPLPEDVDAHL